VEHRDLRRALHRRDVARDPGALGEELEDAIVERVDLLACVCEPDNR